MAKKKFSLAEQRRRAECQTTYSSVYRTTCRDCVLECVSPEHGSAHANGHLVDTVDVAAAPFFSSGLEWTTSTDTNLGSGYALATNWCTSPARSKGKEKKFENCRTDEHNLHSTHLSHRLQSLILNRIGQASQLLNSLPQFQIHPLPLIVTHSP